MKMSARNSFEGTVVSVKEGTISAEVEVKLTTGETLVAGITEGSVHALELKPGAPVVAFVKAPLVLLAEDTGGWKFTARNQLKGVVSHVEKGGVNAAVTLRLSGGAMLSSIITNGAVEDLSLKEGSPVVALFKAGSVVLGVKG
jgi:molybdate transport system regulatory protein